MVCGLRVVCGLRSTRSLWSTRSLRSTRSLWSKRRLVRSFSAPKLTPRYLRHATLNCLLKSSHPLLQLVALLCHLDKSPSGELHLPLDAPPRYLILSHAGQLHGHAGMLLIRGQRLVRHACVTGKYGGFLLIMYAPRGRSSLRYISIAYYIQEIGGGGRSR